MKHHSSLLRHRPARRILPAPRIACAVVAFLALPALFGAGPGRAVEPGPRTILELSGDPVELAAALEAAAALGISVRLGGRGFALVEVGAADLARVEAAFPGSRRLHTAMPPFELVQVRESELDPRGRELAAPRTIYRSESEDLRVLALGEGDRDALARATGTDLDHPHIELGAAHLVPLPASLPPQALAPLAVADRENPYRRSRLADPTARARALALAGDVSAERIEQIVRDLSTGPGATRYSSRTEGNLYARDLLADTLRAIFSAPGDTVFTHPFTATVDGEEMTLYNVVARHPGERAGSGRYVIGGHYDSTARRTPGWNAASDPAPGADDNASGTASAIEAGRVLAQARYDFDLEVVLFGGEEQVLLGSLAYTADSTLAALDEVLGVFVLDMVGFNPRAADSMNVLTNLTSEWLADLVDEAEATLDGDHGLDELDKVVQPTLNYSDHAPFWNKGKSAVLFIENIDIVAHNPNYHRVTDTVDELLLVDGFDLMRRTTETVVATIGQFANGLTPAEPFFLPEKGVLVFDADGDLTVQGVVGERLDARVRVLNSGTSQGTVGASAILRLGGQGVAGRADTVLTGWSRGASREIVVPWTVTQNQVGPASVEVEVRLEDEFGAMTVLSGETSLEIADLVLREVYVRPNPIRGALADGEVRLRLTGETDLRLRVFDASGAQVGDYSGLVRPGQGVFLDQVTGGADLPSGVYLLHLEARVPGGGDIVAQELLKFAYAR